MAVKITIEDDKMVVNVLGIDKLLSFKGSLTIPLEHISSVGPMPEISRRDIGFKLAGSGIPGLIRAGTYKGKDGLAFWNIRNFDNALMFELHDERYSRLFIEVEDPEQTAALIESELSRRS